MSAKKDFNLDISDIPGTKPTSLKYLDRGVKKQNFHDYDN